ncbi:MAG TPA: polymorphic toxin-type HINT domain-containing protein, partial [Saprospiraceae bacterium]|nr:polymorphic toxin-type HINT domain-containing protein [Saprospiraceae bacterium]
KSRFSERTVQSLAQLGDSLKNTTAAYALAALPLVTPVPIQEVQLFDYAVAHKSVNSSYGLTASNDETYIIGNDLFTSDQQRSRDQYQINETDWNEVSFEEVNGTSTCKLALHNVWITNHGYTVDGIVNMNLPEQGISGPFKITSIKHIIPQKKPVDEDEADDYEYRPVTGLFVHESNDVWVIKFDDGTELGVTNNHPIYSVSKGDWQHAGHLEIGEEVLAKSGNTKVVSKDRDLTVQPVYNLEVKDLHNFLVGDDGVVVHNNYGSILDDFLSGIFNATKKFHNVVGACQDYSKALRKYYKNLGHNIETTRVETFLNGKKSGVMSIIDKNGNVIQLSNNGLHEFTRINDKFFDNIYHDGIDAKTYFERFAIQRDGHVSKISKIID